MKMSDYFGELSLCGDCIEDESFHYATTSCEYEVDGVDAGEAICHAVNNHDKLVDALKSLIGRYYSSDEEYAAVMDDAKSILKELGHEV
ncbi:hypothetical protein [Vibrio phage BUCT006]|nr:hypothetical protein [Vibrio phage BUCT006]